MGHGVAPLAAVTLHAVGTGDEPLNPPQKREPMNLATWMVLVFVVAVAVEFCIALAMR